jgi:hypothetical protein
MSSVLLTTPSVLSPSLARQYAYFPNEAEAREQQERHLTLENANHVDRLLWRYTPSIFTLFNLIDCLKSIICC